MKSTNYEIYLGLEIPPIKGYESYLETFTEENMEVKLKEKFISELNEVENEKSIRINDWNSYFDLN